MLELWLRIGGAAARKTGFDHYAAFQIFMCFHTDCFSGGPRVPGTCPYINGESVKILQWEAMEVNGWEDLARN